jgi:bifunctional non-homologous end joining protein LigD
VATPLAWDELSSAVASDHYTIETLPRRLATLPRDPWADIGKLRQSIAGKAPAAGREQVRKRGR